MRALIAMALLLAAGCATQEPTTWYKEGATTADLQSALYECERDTRAGAWSFSGGLQGAGEAQAFAQRCMRAKGFALVTASTVQPSRATTYSGGVAYDEMQTVMCQYRVVNAPATPVRMQAGACVNGGGVITGLAR